eukprot:TRINITY_DN3537_c0_g1_i2.p1 TRINITY_DN3537_c0_g1~~TRINITY_DN3537_c0_g1_i2.p1  ORF type:complete len:128 (+),score=37.39 TRINITY_DN3537_c0_g1_i2:125-508(+)
MIRRPPRSTLSSSSAASDVYKRQLSLSARVGTSAFRANHEKKTFGSQIKAMTPSATARLLVVSFHSHQSCSSGMLHAKPTPYSALIPVSYTHLRAHETPEHLVCRLLLEKKKKKKENEKEQKTLTIK